MKNSTLRLIAIAALFISFAGYNFIRAYDESVWFPPDAGVPPANNVARPINTGTSSQIKSGALGVDTLSVTGEIGITNQAPQIMFNDTNSDNNIWWLHTNAYGSGPRMHLLYDRNKNGVWDAGDGQPSFIVQSGAAVDGTGDKMITQGQVNARSYCDQNGLNCYTAGDINNNASYSTTMNYFSTQNVDTNISKNAICFLTGQNDGGCDTGASCGIGIEDDSWVVHQTQYGDCDRTPSCQYTCTGLAANPTYTYAWSTSAWSVCYAWQSCTTVGSQSRTSYCRRSDGTTANDSMCPGAKPTSSQSCTASPHGHDC